MAESKPKTKVRDFKRAAVIIAYPCDETLWAGGTILLNTDCDWTIMSVFSKEGTDRSEKFRKAVKRLNKRARPVISNIESPDKVDSLQVWQLQQLLDSTLPSERFDLVITHSLWGEYSKEKGSNKIAKAVMGMRDSRQIITKELWMFAYGEQQGADLPKPSLEADKVMHLPGSTHQEKREIITDIYGYPEDSVEAKAASKKEAFWVLQPGGRA